MATGKSCYVRPSYRFLATDQPYHAADSGFEFEESDLYSAGSDPSDSPELRRKLYTSGTKPSPRSPAAVSGSASSLPMNVPDWSNILREDSRRRIRDYDGREWSEYGGGIVPPHELLARTRIASLSVHEGVGRTLKGRDLSMIRNAIFEKIGFQD